MTSCARLKLHWILIPIYFSKKNFLIGDQNKYSTALRLLLTYCSFYLGSICCSCVFSPIPGDVEQRASDEISFSLIELDGEHELMLISCDGGDCDIVFLRLGESNILFFSATRNKINILYCLAYVCIFFFSRKQVKPFLRNEMI